MCENDPDWSFLGEVIADAFGSKEEEWIVFKVYDSELPALSDISTFSGFVITGSHNASYDQIAWIVHFRQFLEAYARLPTAPSMVGICFGHQIIAHGTHLRCCICI